MRTSGQAISKVGTIIARVYKNLISIGLQVRRRSYGGDYGLGWGEYELTLEGFRRKCTKLQSFHCKQLQEQRTEHLVVLIDSRIRVS